MLFETFWEEKRQFEENLHKKQVPPPPMANSPAFNQSILFKNIEDRNSMSEAELKYFIHNNFTVIMNNVFAPEVSPKYLQAFQEPRFLDAFIDVVSQLKYFDSDIGVRINLIVYDYIVTYSDSNPAVLDRMKKLATIVNYSKSILLKKYNLPMFLDIYLLVSRYSTFDLNICVRRVNLMLIRNQKLASMLNIDPDSETSSESIDFLARLLVDLFSLDTWNLVLSYFMLDVLPAYDERNPVTQWVTPDVEAMDSAISLAILKVLDTMIASSAALKNVIATYAEGYRMMNWKKPVRFSFQSISEDYPRLKSVLKYLEDEEKLIVP